MAEALKPRESLFVAATMAGNDAVASAIAAGWSPKYARKNAHLILKRPHVQAAIAEAQEKLREASAMTAEKLLRNLEEDRRHAREWKQGTAMVRADEMIGKLTGLIQDKTRVEIEVRPSIGDAIDQARARAGLPPRAPGSVPQIIDSTANEVTPVDEPSENPFGE